MALSTQPYKGTRDFYPEDMRVRTWMFDRIRKTLARYGYEEYDGPMLESFELYAAKTSEEIVNEQLYWLVDRGDRKMAMRPEMTPTLARMVAGRQHELPKPIRWFSIPNLWRYERPQRGRLREHWQLNVDVFGGEPLSEDLEIAQIIVALMHGFGATEGFEIRLNHRELTNYVFGTLLGLTGDRMALAGRLLDAAPKMGEQGFKAALEKDGFTADQIGVLLGLVHGDPALKAKLESQPAYQHLGKLFSGLERLGIAKYFRYEPSVMRGFMYYTGMVLEVFDMHPDNNRALFGGGRYDNLVGLFGGQPLPGVGFGMGDVTLRHFLETHKLLPNLREPRGVFVAHLDDAQLLDAQKLAAELRKLVLAEDEPVLTALTPDKPRKHFTTAEKLAARSVIFVGSDDVARGEYPIKDMVSGEQASGDAKALAKFLAARPAK